MGKNSKGKSIMECWGITTLIDLYGCDVNEFKSEIGINVYITDLIKLIDMKKFGELDLVHFGTNKKVEGYTAIQKIETSSIVCHFANQSGYADIIIDSCKPYSSKKAVHFSKKYFSASKVKYRVIKRGIEL